MLVRSCARVDNSLSDLKYVLVIMVCLIYFSYQTDPNNKVNPAVILGEPIDRRSICSEKNVENFETRRQGHEEFEREVFFISKLQHRNRVRKHPNLRVYAQQELGLFHFRYDQSL